MSDDELYEMKQELDELRIERAVLDVKITFSTWAIVFFAALSIVFGFIALTSQVEHVKALKAIEKQEAKP